MAGSAIFPQETPATKLIQTLSKIMQTVNVGTVRSRQKQEENIPRDFIYSGEEVSSGSVGERRGRVFGNELDTSTPEKNYEFIQFF